VDILVHTAPTAGPWSPELIEKMKAQHIALIPTLQLFAWEGRHDRSSQVTPWVDMAIGQLRAFARAGGTVLFGTDVGYTDAYDPTLEYELMGQAGLSYQQILASLTTAPVERFASGQKTGTIAPGFDADLVVLNADPAASVRAFTSVRHTFRAGRQIYSSKLRSPSSPP